MIAAFFDLDMTIINTQSGKIIFKDAFRQGLFKKKELFQGYWMIILKKLGLLQNRDALNKIATWHKGISVEEMDVYIEKWHKLLKEYIRIQAQEAIAWHENQGHPVIILSAAPHYICEKFKNELSFDDVISTQFEIIHNIFTGKISGEYCFGEEKLKRIIPYCKTKGYTIEKAYFYSDSINDLPTLKAVGHPVCVTPDKSLKKIAHNKNWEIQYW